MKLYWSMRSALVSLIVMICLVAVPAFAGELHKTLSSPFTAPVGSFATALSGNLTNQGNIYCNAVPGACWVAGVSVTLKSPDQDRISVKAYVNNHAVTLSRTTLGDGSFQFSGTIGTGGPGIYAARTDLSTSSGAAVTLTPANGDVLKLDASAP